MSHGPKSVTAEFLVFLMLLSAKNTGWYLVGTGFVPGGYLGIPTGFVPG